MKTSLQSHQQHAYVYQPQYTYRQQTYQHLAPTPQQYSYHHAPQPMRRAIAPAYYASSYGRSLPSKNIHAPTTIISNSSYTQAPRRVTRHMSETINMQYNMNAKANLPKKKFCSTYSSRLKQGHTALVLPMIKGGKKRQRGGGHGSLAEDSDDVADLFEDEVINISSSEKRVATGLATDVPVVNRVRSRTKHVYNSHKELERNAEQKEILIPIKLDFDIGTHKLRDTFTWNLNEKLITPEHFAEIMCLDLDLPSSEFVATIADSIRKQIQENEMMTDCNSPKDDSRLDINVGKLSLRDRFEWDLSSDLTPEEFSKYLVSDLGIGGEFVTLIAHSIHEQLLKYKKEIKSDDSDNEHEPLKSVFRNIEDVDEWCPVLEILTEEELEKIRLDKERDIRRMRRATSRSIARIRPTRTSLQNGISFSPGSPTSRMRSDLKATKLSVEELVHWRCQHCGIDGHNTPLVRKGPGGGKTLCNACGLVWLNKGELPLHRKALFKKDDD
ncbi:7442_t:CDS:2 [Funneliformis caledonium]|uniref:7442_t:CDS:1 n=1 Tax=Funneliformis caledonium TaxID=1117310 RepID=A0A9N8ZH55_9GLOM|nr:7442_t:CDS:2 [Funneliformis caledonium]